MSGVKPEDSLLKLEVNVAPNNFPSPRMARILGLLKYLIWKDAEEDGDSSVAVRLQLVRRGSSP